MSKAYPDYLADKEECKKFLSSFRSNEDGTSFSGRGAFKYMDLLQKIADRRINSIDIQLSDLNKFLQEESGMGGISDIEPLVQRIMSNARRYVSILSEAVDDLLLTLHPSPNAAAAEDIEEDVYDILMRQRMEQQQQARAASGAPGADAGAPGAQDLPSVLRRRYELNLVPPVLGGKEGKRAVQSLRDVKASSVGHLVTVEGIVTRCTDVKPLLQVATYTCDECGFEIYQEVTGRTFMPLTQCPSQRCRTNNTLSLLHLHTRGSKFLKYQEARIQEMADRVPKGHIPRSMSVHIRGELTRQLAPGDVVQISGIFLPAPFVGYQAIRAGLTADTFLEATHIHHLKKRFSEYASDQSEEEAEAVRQLALQDDVYSRLAKSIAPEIFGHEDVKKALLLLLVGAPSRALPDGMKMRGDLHICLMGDPGVAKSQMLKHIVSVAPRGVYTTGKGSSGVGLTAAVVKDPVTSELVLEGGALVLADMGVCAIDEFDKMDENDRTAIHEVMEQQTASIAKAGITTSLNARTSVLAAANPAWGRYDLRRTPAENINLPPALLSRFDLLWLILDRADVDSDLALARHVLHVHQFSAPPVLDFQPVETNILRAYIAAAREVAPCVPRDLTDYLASAYSSLRQEEANSDAPPSYTTARTLLSVLRLSEALARLRFSATVAQSDVDEALRLMQMSKSSLIADAAKRQGMDAVSHIYSTIRDEAMRASSSSVTYADALNWVTRKGYSEAELRECLEEYATLNVWHIDADTLNIRFVDAP